MSMVSVDDSSLQANSWPKSADLVWCWSRFLTRVTLSHTVLKKWRRPNLGLV